MKSLRKDAERAPVSNIIIVLLLVIGFASFPIKDTIKLFGLEYNDANRYIFTAAFRVIFCAVMLYFLYTYKLQRTLTFRMKKFWAVLPCYLVVINNFPIVALATGQARVDASAGLIALYLAQTFFITAFEEIALRGIIFPLCYFKLKGKKRAVFWSVALSSAFFGAVHLVNLLGGAGIGSVALQIGYSFLIGAMCAVALLITESLFVPISLHFIFNAGGLLVEELGAGDIVNLPTVILTLVIGVLVGTYILYAALKIGHEKFDKLTACERPEDEMPQTPDGEEPQDGPSDGGYK